MSKTRMGKRVASLLLSLVMMLSLLPTTVYATGDTGETKNEIVGQATTSGDNTEGTGEPEPTGEGEDGGTANVSESEDGAATNDAVVEETIAPVNAEGVDAVANAESSGDEVSGEDGNELVNFVTVNGVHYATLEAAIGAATPDANGVITYTINGKVEIGNSDEKTNEQWISVVGAKAAGTSSVKFVGNSEAAEISLEGMYALLANQGNDLDVSFEDLKLSHPGGAYKSGNGSVGHMINYFACVLRNTNAAENTVTYTNCTFPNGVCNNQYGKTVFDNCQFTNATGGLYNLWNYGGNTEVKDSTFTGTRGIKAYSEGTDGGSIKVAGTKFDNLTQKAAIVASKPVNVEVSNVDVTGEKGFFTRDITGNDEVQLTVAGTGISGTFEITSATDAGAAKKEFNISAGTFTSEVSSDYLADGFEIKPSTDASGNTTYGVVEAATAVAKIGDKEYATLQAAIDAAKTGDTVTLLADIEQNSCLVINNKDIDITLDLNGKKIYNTVDIWSDTDVSLISIKGGAKVTITGNGTIKAKDNDCYTFNVVNGGLTIENGTFVGNISVVQVQTGSLEINGGKFSLAQKWEGKNTYLINCIDDKFESGAAKVAISGGTFEDFDPNVSPEKPVNGKVPSFAAPGVGITKNDDGIFTATPNMVAQIIAADGSSVKAYNVLADAIAAAQDGQTVTLLADTTEDVTIDKNITLDLGGKTLTNTKAGKATISVTGGTVTVKNGTVIGGTSYYNIEVTKGSNANLTLEDVTATAGNTGSSMIDNWGTLTINSGTYTGGLDVVKSEEGSKLTITGGKFTLEYATNGYTGVVFAYGDTTISGGEFIQSLTTTGQWNHPTVILTGVVEGYTAITRVTGGHFVNNMSGESIFRGVGKGTSDNFEVSGGTFNKSISDGYCTDGFIPTKNADGTYGVKEGQYVAKVGSTKYETLADAIRLAANGKTVKLLCNVTENVTIAAAKKDLTLDLNGFTLNGGTGTAKAALTNYGTITIKDSSADKAGTIKRDDNGIPGETSYYVIDNHGTMTIEGGNVINNSGYRKPNPSGSMVGSSLIRNGGTDAGATLTITGGTLEQTNFIAIKNDALGKLRVTGGKITSNHSAIQNWYEATITGGEITGQLWTDAYMVGESVGVTTIGGDAKFTGEIVMDIYGSVAPTLAITGGKLDVTNWRITPAAAKAGAKPAVSGGTFKAAVPENYCAEGYIPKDNGDGTYGVKGQYVAQVLDKNGKPVGGKYETLQAAINAAARNATVTMLADTNENVTISTRDLTLDLNGFTLNGGTEKGKPALTVTARMTTVKDSSTAQTGTIMRDDTAENSGVSSHYVIDVQGNGWLTFEGGNVKNGSGVVGVKGASLVRVGDDSVKKYPGLTINGGTFTQDNFIAIKVDRGHLNLNGGEVNSANSYAVENWCNANIKGGTVNGTVSTWVYNKGSATSNLTIEGGTVKGDVASVNYDSAADKQARVFIKGGEVTGTLGTYTYNNGLVPTEETSMATIKVSGGTFNNAVEARYCDEGYTPVRISDGKYGVQQQQQQVLAKIDDIAYYTMDEAFNAVREGETIVMQRDYTTVAEQNSGSKSFAIDLNGHTWTYTGTNTNCAAFQINYPNVTLTVKNGTVVSNSMVGLIPSAMGAGGTTTYDNAGLVFEGVTMTANGHSGIETNGNNTDDTVTLKNSTLNVPNGFGIYFPSSGKLTIDNSKINAKTMGVQVCSGSLSINAGSAITVNGDAVTKTENDGAIQDGAAISIVNRPGYKGLDKIEVTGGTFTAKDGNKAIKAYKWENQTASAFSEETKVAVSGGTFSSIPDNMAALCKVGYRAVEDKDNNVYIVKEGKYVIEVTSRIQDTNQTVATPTGGGQADYGEEVTVTTYAVTGFTFLGWYDSEGKQLSTQDDMTYTHKVTGDCTLVAKYAQDSTRMFRLTVNGTVFTVNERTEYAHHYSELASGSRVAIVYTGTDNFLYWVNASKNVVTTNKTLEYTMVNDAEFTAVTAPATSDSAIVVFKNNIERGQELQARRYYSNETIVFPATPSSYGKTFAYWAILDTNGNILKDQAGNAVVATESAIKAKIAESTGYIVVAAVYTANGYYKATAHFVDSNGNTVANDMVNANVPTGSGWQVTAPDVDKKFFSHWKDADGNVLSTNQTYAIYAMDTVEVTAVYVDTENDKHATMNTVKLTALTRVVGNSHDLGLVAQYDVASGKTINSVGILFTTNANYKDSLTLENKKVSTSAPLDKPENNSNVYRYWLNGINNLSTVVYARAYVTTTDGETIYSEVIEGSFNSWNGN